MERVLSKAERAQIIKLYDGGRGMYQHELARKFNVSEHTIDKILGRL